ncbi:rRNA-processing protein fcf1 [Microbotryomycetes sp. JL221]|nr:rRNA-processing protein fcf1 [Microbotryomycetes sp. JL221]
MGKSAAKKVRKFGAVKRMLAPTDMRLKANQEKQQTKEANKKKQETNQVDTMPSSMFFTHNEALVPPYRVLVDTNFINLSLENRIDLVKAMMDALYAKAIPCISDCVIAELEKLGHQYRLALRCYIVATCDRQLRRRLRKIPGVPLMYIAKKRYAIERLPDQAIG